MPGENPIKLWRKQSSLLKNNFYLDFVFCFIFLRVVGPGVMRFSTVRAVRALLYLLNWVCYLGAVHCHSKISAPFIMGVAVGCVWMMKPLLVLACGIGPLHGRVSEVFLDASSPVCPVGTQLCPFCHSHSECPGGTEGDVSLCLSLHGQHREAANAEGAV